VQVNSSPWAGPGADVTELGWNGDLGHGQGGEGSRRKWTGTIKPINALRILTNKQLQTFTDLLLV